jgi:hypothetical protein
MIRSDQVQLLLLLLLVALLPPGVIVLQLNETLLSFLRDACRKPVAARCQLTLS